MSLKLSKKDRARFWSRVQKRGVDECWLWDGGKKPDTYGQFSVGSIQYVPSRVMWIIDRGEIPGDLFVLHKCDNPPCVNPAHLFLGDHQDNAADMVAKGRHRLGPNQPKHPRAISPNKKRLNISMDRAIWKQGKQMATLDDRSFSNFLEVLILERKRLAAKAA